MKKLDPEYIADWIANGCSVCPVLMNGECNGQYVGTPTCAGLVLAWIAPERFAPPENEPTE